uniref:Uncharacterized protein n=1 Tax=Arundo donax TaxID=35708 RepID=A0A0A8YDX6_ARUDO
MCIKPNYSKGVDVSLQESRTRTMIGWCRSGTEDSS